MGLDLGRGKEGFVFLRKAVRGASRLAAILHENLDLAVLFRELATLRVEAPLIASIDELRWQGPTTAFADVCETLGAPPAPGAGVAED